MHDEELRNAFQELRAHVERTVPPFAAPAVESVPARSSHSSWTRLRADSSLLRQAAIVTLIAFGAGGLLWMRAQSRVRHASVRDTEATILKWTAPTDVLLQTPGRELLAATPVLSESVVRPVTFSKRY